MWCVVGSNPAGTIMTTDDNLPSGQVCPKCHGSGWVWWDELDNYAGHNPTDLIVDDTRYSCDLCQEE